jgi:hypothetical protein
MYGSYTRCSKITTKRKGKKKLQNKGTETSKLDQLEKATLRIK